MTFNGKKLSWVRRAAPVPTAVTTAATSVKPSVASNPTEFTASRSVIEVKAPMNNITTTYLPALGVYGFDRYEPVILAALVSEDPMLLIGRSGTGKTFLLNSLSEALGLEHRHYNASLISFDDLVGFPYPDSENSTVKFLETPATVWSAESVLIDEISRCKPEHQNRLFSLVHERRVQGIALTKLRYRWAAMNPASTDQSDMESYTGSEPLDPALADRFALFVKAVDWEDLNDEERAAVTSPSGEGKLAAVNVRLLAHVQQCRRQFVQQIEVCPQGILDYVTTAVTALNGAKIRISPRRARLMARSLLAATLVTGTFDEMTARLVLECSLPHCTWGVEIAKPPVDAVHRLAWNAASRAETRWVDLIFAEFKLSRKLEVLLKHCPSPDEGTQAVAQILASEPPDRAAAFAFALYPAAAMGKLPVGSEGANDLGRLASPILSVDAEVTWSERGTINAPHHPGYDAYAKLLGTLSGTRAERAKQFFSWCLTEQIVVGDPAGTEREIEACAVLLKKAMRAS
jgi:MoxR-like ATPase